MNKNYLTSFFIRIGLGGVFLYAAFSAFLDPLAWLGFFPIWMHNMLPVSILLIIWSIYEVLLALWLFSGWKLKQASLVAAITLIVITIVNLRGLDIVFRDVAIFFAALGLYYLPQDTKRKKK